MDDPDYTPEVAQDMIREFAAIHNREVVVV